MPWRDDPRGLEAWQRGETGFRLVDAGMRQLWQRGWLKGELRDRLVAYWSRQLAGVTPLDLPTDRPRPPIRTA